MLLEGSGHDRILERDAELGGAAPAADRPPVAPLLRLDEEGVGLVRRRGGAVEARQRRVLERAALLGSPVDVEDDAGGACIVGQGEDVAAEWVAFGAAVAREGEGREDEDVCGGHERAELEGACGGGGGGGGRSWCGRCEVAGSRDRRWSGGGGGGSRSDDESSDGNSKSRSGRSRRSDGSGSGERGDGSKSNGRWDTPRSSRGDTSRGTSRRDKAGGSSNRDSAIGSERGRGERRSG